MSVVGRVIWEVLGEIVFLALVGLVSWLVYEELRWPFIAAVFLGVNAVLVVIAVIVWVRRRRSGGGRGGGGGRGRGRGSGRGDGRGRGVGRGRDGDGADAIRDRTGR